MTSKSYSSLFTVSSSGMRTMSLAAEQVGVPLIAGFQSTNSTRSSHRRWTFAPGTPPEARSQSLFEVLALNKAKTVISINERFPGADSLSLTCSQVSNILAGLRMNLVAQLDYLSPLFLGLSEENTTSYLQQQMIQPLMNFSTPDVLFFCTPAGRGLFFLEAARDANYNPKAVIIPEDLSNEDVILDEKFQYVYGLTQWSPALQIPQGEFISNASNAISEIIHRFKELQNSSAANEENVAVSLAALATFQQALFSTSDMSLSAIQFAISRVSFPSFFGEIRFGVTGLDIAHQMAAFQIYQGQRVFVSPLRYAPMEAIYPAPTWNERVQDLGWYQYSSEVVFAVLTGLLILVSLLWMIFVIYFQERQAIQYSAPEYLILMLFGTILMNSTIYAWMIYVTDASCAAIPWLLSLGYLCMMSSLLLKNYRVYRCWTASKAFRPYRLPHSRIALFFILVFLPVIALLIAWTISAPLYQKLHVVDPLRPSKNYVKCAADDVAVGFIGALIGYSGLFLIANMMLAVKTWSIDRAILREGASIALATYTFCLSAAIGIGIVASGQLDIELEFIIRSSCILSATLSVMSFIMIPKALYIYNNKTILNVSTLTPVSYTHLTLPTN